MSEIYANEPVTSGKVVLHTTMGPLDVELWSREAPRTCRSFVQLCLEGYYDNTIFHRLIPGFLLQGGDPFGTGEGGLSIYDDPQQVGSPAGASPAARGLKSLKPCEGPPLSLELNSRLRFRYRGLMGAASKAAEGAAEGGGGRGAPKKGGTGGGRPAHIGSQFFFTLGSAEALNGKHTLFGKVTGPSLFNLLRMGELPIDKYDRPRAPPKITKTQVVYNPFRDIAPRCLPPAEEEQEEEKEEQEQQQQQRPQLATTKSNLLSFTDEDEDTQLQQQQPKAPLSAHDLLEDPKLSREAPSAASWRQQQQQAAANKLKARVASLAAARGSAAAAAEELPYQSSISSSSGSESETRNEHSSRRRSRSRSKSRERGQRGPLRRGPPQVLGKKEFAAAVAAQPDADLLSPAEQRRRLLLLQRKTKSAQDRRKETLEKLSAFKQQLRFQAKNSSSSGSSSVEEAAAAGKRDQAAEAARAAAARATELELPAVPPGNSESDEEEGPLDRPWYQTGGLRFAIDSTTAYHMDAARAELEVRDPLKNKNAAAADPKLQMRKMPHAHGEGKPRELARW